jgi:hypothetical protein
MIFESTHLSNEKKTVYTITIYDSETALIQKNKVDLEMEDRADQSPLVSVKLTWLALLSGMIETEKEIREKEYPKEQEKEV